MKILINTEVTSEQQQQIESVSDDLLIVHPQNSEEALREIVDTDVVLVDLTAHFSRMRSS